MIDADSADRVGKNIDALDSFNKKTFFSNLQFLDTTKKLSDENKITRNIRKINDSTGCVYLIRLEYEITFFSRFSSFELHLNPGLKFFPSMNYQDDSLFYVTINIKDSNNEKIFSLYSDTLSKGNYFITWYNERNDGRKTEYGDYFYEIKVNLLDKKSQILKPDEKYLLYYLNIRFPIIKWK